MTHHGQYVLASRQEYLVGASKRVGFLDRRPKCAIPGKRCADTITRIRVRFIDGAEGQLCYSAKRIEGYNGFLYSCLWYDRRKRLLDLNVYRPVVSSF